MPGRPLLVLSLLGLAACHQDFKINEVDEEPLTLTVTSPTYGAFTASRMVVVTGTVSPADAEVIVDGERAEVDADGTWHRAVQFPDGDRAMVADVEAISPSEEKRVLVPFFDGSDPRLTDPGAITMLLTPTGLDGLEPLVADGVDNLAWEDQILSLLPTVDTTYFDLLPDSVTSDGVAVDLSPTADGVAMTLDFQNIQLTSEVVIADTWSFPVTISMEDILFGASALPAVDGDGMMSLTLQDAVADLSPFGLSFGGYDIPSEIMDLLTQPLADLVSALGAGLVNVLLDQAGTIALGGPYAFSTDLMGTTLAARLADVSTSTDGVSLGVTVSTDGDAATSMPALDPMAATTPAGLPYQFGIAMHEGLLNTLLDDTLAGFLDIDLQLDAATSDLIGGGIRALPGGDQMPQGEGMCLGIHAGDARVIRFAEGQGSPLAQVWMPDLQVAIQTVQEGTCVDWLDAELFAVIDLNLDGTQVGTRLDIRKGYVTYYGAKDVDQDEVGDKLGSVIEGLASLLMSQVSFDLGDLLGGATTNLPATDPQLISVEPIDGEGRYGIYLDIF